MELKNSGPLDLKRNLPGPRKRTENTEKEEEGKRRKEKSVATGVRMKVHAFFLRRNTLLPLVPTVVMERARPPPKN